MDARRTADGARSGPRAGIDLWSDRPAVKYARAMTAVPRTMATMGSKSNNPASASAAKLVRSSSSRAAVKGLPQRVNEKQKVRRHGRANQPRGVGPSKLLQHSGSQGQGPDRVQGRTMQVLENSCCSPDFGRAAVREVYFSGESDQHPQPAGNQQQPQSSADCNHARFTHRLQVA